MAVAPRPPTVLVLAPMPAYPTSAGNRARVVATCDALRRGGFAVDFAYFEHEDQIYRRFGQNPPTDAAAMAAAFQRTFLIPARTPIPLKTWATGFPLDAWCPDEVVAFVAWYFETYPETCAVVVNYVFLSRCLEAVPEGVRRIVDTHDRFADRQLQYRPFRSEPNFFYTSRQAEAEGLSRADTVLAIQSAEAAYFRELVDRDVRLLPPLLAERRDFSAPRRIATIGFIGHGNDPNLFSIGKFAHEWAAGWQEGMPTLVVAGEICNSLGGLALPGLRLAGYVARIEDFYDEADVVVAPMLMGSGLKMKVAEALSMGRPVVGTRIGFEGFDTQIPAHRLDGIADCVATIQALRDDADGLAALTRACADLLARYNAVAVAAEAAWLATIPRRPGAPADRTPEPAATGTNAVAVGPALLSRQRSPGSLAASEAGVLVATEEPSPEAARAAHYTPARTRWFARTLKPGEALPEAGAAEELRGAGLALSPEWVRGRALPGPVRAALAPLFAEARADWSAQARLIGRDAARVEAAAYVPSFLLTGRRPAAVFLFDAAGAGREMTLAGLAPLARQPGLAFEGRDDLTPVPAILSLAPADERGAEADLPEPAGLLLLTDGLIGRLWFRADPNPRMA